MRRKLNNARITAAFLVLTLAVTAFGALPVYAEGGECGDNLSWVFSAGTLIITGKGDMDKFSETSPAPWYEFREEITRVTFPDGISSIGTLAFRGCVNLKTVILPDSVRSIGAYAFSECESLQLLNLGKGLTSIGNGAFHSCVNLESVYLPYGVNKIGYQAFYRCESLVEITLPPNLTNLGTSAFAYCTSLVTATVNARLDTIPEWTFYGCDMLDSVVLAETVKEVDTYAFKNCDMLSTVYYTGNAKDTVDQSISADNPNFGSFGHITNSAPPQTSTSNKTTENDDGGVTEQETSVRREETVTVVTKVETNTTEDTSVENTYKAEVSVTVENKDGWSVATEAVKDALKDINESQFSFKGNTTVTVQLKNDDKIDKDFLSSLAGRDVKITVVSANGSIWRVDCSKLDAKNLSDEYNYSYTVTPADNDICEKIGTDSCYRVAFTASAQINAEVLIQLPASVSVSRNAFLYQQESDGTFTRLQAVAVDDQGVAHFYLASADKDTLYVIGLNVPGEKTDDVIIPDELAATNNAIQRLEVIEYVTTGVRNYNGLTLKHLTIIIIVVVVVTSVVVGVVMYMLNKHNVNKMRQSNM